MVEFRSTVDVELVEVSATDLRVAKAAWVSTKGKEAEDADEARLAGLINFLLRDRHGSPFEHSSFTFAIRCPIFVVREFHRPRAGWSYNEESGRYSKLRPEFYVPAPNRNLVQTGKPGHYIFGPGSEQQHKIATAHMVRSVWKAWDSYEEMLEAGIAKEVARMVLPLNIYTSFYATCNARSLMHFLSLRTENTEATYPSHPQKEIQMVADQMEEFFKDQMPFTWAAWNTNGRVAP